MNNEKRFKSNGVLMILVAATIWTLLASGPNAFSANGEEEPGIGEWCRLDLLPKLKPWVTVGSVSSYDRTGGNDDGFSGAHSFIRKEEGGLVIADLEGPGIIYRIHTPSPSDKIIEFYFDGETSPRISMKFRHLFTGTHSPFLSPIVGSGVGGNYCYLPIPYQRSCKILVKTETFYFYQINYARFPADTVIPSYQDPPSDAFLGRLDRARATLASTGSDISSHLVPEGTRVETAASRHTLKPGQSVTLFETAEPGRIVGLRIGPASAFAGKDRDILIRIFWDGSEEPAVLCPVGDFFGYSFGEPAVRSLFNGTDQDQNYCYLPMPFERSAKIELVSERTMGAGIDLSAEVAFARLGRADDEGRFYALWRRENPTQEGTPYTFLKTNGQGHVIGVFLQSQGLVSGATPFFEGDDQGIIDGELTHPGTGTEDFLNGGWYDVPGRWEARASFPLSGCLDYKKPLARTGGYRWMITDAYRYSKSIDFTVEHGPEGNKTVTDYTSVTFFYSLTPPETDSPLPAPAARKITDPQRIVFVPGWNVPIKTFSFRNMTLTKIFDEVKGNKIRYLSVKTSGRGSFGRQHISFICEMPSRGRYRVGLKAIMGPDQAQVQQHLYDHPVGDPVNLYAEERCLSQVLPLSVLELEQGDNVVYLHLVGKDERSTGLGLDIVELVFERVD